MKKQIAFLFAGGRSLSRLQAAIALLAFFCLCALTSCNGNGGSSDSGGPTYNQSPSSTPTGSTASGSDTGTVSVNDILAFSNAGDTEMIVSRLSGGSTPTESAATTAVAFSSAGIGLPAGGYVTLVITGNGISYTADARDAGDGTVHFDIPQIASGTTITVGVIVKRASGTVVCAGSKTQTVSGDSSNIQISLTSESPLPAAITVNASPTAITYDASAPAPQTVSFSVVGLEAPEEGTLAYSWKLADGTVLPGSGTSVDVTLDSLFGTAPTAGGLYNKSVQVTATYTDEEGTATTANGTGVVAVTVLELPDFTIEVTLPEGVTAHTNEAGGVIPDSYDIADLTKPFTFKATPVAGTGYPAGGVPEETEFTWGQSYDSTMAGGYDSSVSEHQPDHIDVQPSSLNLMYSQWYATDTSPKTFYVSCSATNGKAINSPKSAASSKTVNLYKPKLPTPVLSYSCTAGDLRTAVTDTAVATYYAPSGSTDPKTDTEFTFEIGNKSAFPADAKWKLVAGSHAYGVGISTSAANTGRDSQLTYVALGSLTDDMAAPCTTNDIKIVVEHPSYVSSESDALTFMVYPTPPAASDICDFAGHISSDAGGLMECVFEVYDDSSSITCSLSPSPSTASLPDASSGAEYKWYLTIGSSPRTLVKTTDSPDDVSFALTELGIHFSSLPDSDADSGLHVEFECVVSFPGTVVTKTSARDPEHSWLELYKAAD